VFKARDMPLTPGSIRNILIRKSIITHLQSEAMIGFGISRLIMAVMVP